MNRMFSTFLVIALAATVGLGAETVVTSANTVGYKTVALPPGGSFIMLSMNFDAFDQTFLGVFGTDQLTKNNKVGNADNIYVWDPALNGGLGGYLKFYQKADGTFSPSNAPFVAGQAVWLGSPVASVTTNVLTLAGEAVDVVTQSTDIVTGFQMVGFPFSADKQLADTTFAADGATANNKVGLADNLYIWDGAGYSKAYLKPTGWDPDKALVLGQGFWYEARNPFMWDSTNTYLNNL